MRSVGAATAEAASPVALGVNPVQTRSGTARQVPPAGRCPPRHVPTIVVRSCNRRKRSRRALDRLTVLVARRDQAQQAVGGGSEHNVRQRHGAIACGGLGRREVRRPAGQQNQLGVHPQRAPQEVHPVAGQPEQLPLPKAGPGSHANGRAVASGHFVGQRKNRLTRQRDEITWRCFGQRDPLARADRDEPVGDGGPEHHPQHGVDRRRCGRRQQLGPALDPGLNLGPGNRGQRAMTERRHDVVANVGVEDRHGGTPVHLGRLPDPRILADTEPTRCRIDVETSGLVALHAGQEQLGIDLPCEGAGSFSTVGIQRYRARQRWPDP